MSPVNAAWTRRRWIKTALAGSAGLALARFAGAEELAAAADAKPVERFVELFNTHTSETFRAVNASANRSGATASMPRRRIKPKNTSSSHQSRECCDGNPLWRSSTLVCASSASTAT